MVKKRDVTPPIYIGKNIKFKLVWKNDRILFKRQYLIFLFGRVVSIFIDCAGNELIHIFIMLQYIPVIKQH